MGIIFTRRSVSLQSIGEAASKFRSLEQCKIRELYVQVWIILVRRSVGLQSIGEATSKFRHLDQCKIR